LREPIQHLILLEGFLFIPSCGDSFRKISALGVLHDDFEFVLFGGVHFHEADDERMLEGSQDLCLFYSLFLLLLAHVVDAHFFYHQQLACLLTTHKICLAECALPQKTLFLVDLVLCLNDSHLHQFKNICKIILVCP
jgi:hypothetical protein